MSRQRRPGRPPGPGPHQSPRDLEILRGPLSDTEAGERLGLSRQRVAQIRRRLEVPGRPLYTRVVVYRDDALRIEQLASERAIDTAAVVAGLLAEKETT